MKKSLIKNNLPSIIEDINDFRDNFGDSNLDIKNNLHDSLWSDSLQSDFNNLEENKEQNKIKDSKNENLSL